jgi:hypothetical protein
LNTLTGVSEKSSPAGASRNMIFFDFFSQFFLIPPPAADVPAGLLRRNTPQGFTSANG